MNWVSAFKFLEPGWLLLLPVILCALWYFALRFRAESMWQRVCDPHLLRWMTGGAMESQRKRWPVWSLAAVLILGIVAAAGPSWRSQPYPLVQSSDARVIALSLSRSMLVQDVKPNRYDLAVAAARSLLTADFDGETALVVFSGAAFVVSPLSTDAKTLLAFLDSLNPEIMPVDGARLDLAITRAGNLLDASVSRKGQILVITDRADNVEAATRAALEASSHGHRVNLLAVGTREGGPLRDPAGGLIRDSQGNYEISATNFDELARVSEVGNGSLIRVKRDLDYSDAILHDQDINARLVDEADETGSDLAVNDGVWLVWLMLPLALLLFRRNALWTVLLVFWLPTDAELRADDWDSLWKHAERRAHQAYQSGDYAKAVEHSTDAILIGSAYYKMGEYSLALDHLRRQESAISYYNRGNVYAQQSKFPEAVVAYGRALSLDSTMEDAAYNRKLIQAYLEQADGGTDSADDGAEGEQSTEETELGSTPSQLGEGGQVLANAGDSPESGVGTGASLQSGLPDLSEQYNPQEQPMEQFILNSTADRENLDPVLVERWLKTLPESSSELFRRKFLRDYQRQTTQQR